MALQICFCRLDSDDGCFDLPRLGRNTQGIVYRFLVGFCACCLADVNSSAIFSLEAHCDPLLVFQLAAYRFPTVVNALRLQLGADRMHQVVGQQGNE